MTASILIVYAKFDSMGGVVDGEVGIASSPHKAAIEKVQADLREECGIRDERKRELEFLEKGGNPLEFKLGIIASFTIQSTSVTDQHPGQFGTSEAKVSLEISASPHGDSVESSGRPAKTLWAPNGADNLLLFDAENEFSEDGRKLFRRSSILQSEQSLDGGHKTRENGDLAALSLPRKAYKRRKRSRPNHDGTSLPTCHADNQNLISNQNSKPTSPINHSLPKTVVADGQEIELYDLKASLSIKDQVKGVSVDTALAVIAPENPLCDQVNQRSLSVVADTPKQMSSSNSEAIRAEEMAKTENRPDFCQMNDFGRKIADDLLTETHNNASRGTKVLESEPSCIKTSLSVNRNNDSEICTRVTNPEPNRNLEPQTLPDGTATLESNTEGIIISDFVNKEHAFVCQNNLDTDSLFLPKKELDQVESALKDKVTDQGINNGMEALGPTQLGSGVKHISPLLENPQQPKETSSDARHQETFDVLKSELREVGFSNRVSTVPLEAQSSHGPDSILTCKIDEDSILKEAQIIEAKRKRIAELSAVTSSVEICQKSHWDYVLKEMTWLANDFAQERVWKLAAASQISYRVAAASRLKKQERTYGLEAKRVAHTMAKAVMEFWHSIELQVHETSKEVEQNFQKNGALSVRAYAVRFLKSDNQNIFTNRLEVPLTPDRISDCGVLDLSWDDSLTEESLFYKVPSGAMEASRMAIESHMAQYERIQSSAQEEVESSACDAAADFESRDYPYDEDEGEADMYTSRYGQKNRKALIARPYEVGSDILPMHSVENKLVTPKFALLEKRSGSNINVSIPTKRMRTASRRVIQVPNTNSFQDDQSNLRGSVVPNSLEIESAGEYEKQLPFDPEEVSTKPKKKKKAKHLNAAYEHRWQAKSSFQNEQFQRDHFQRRTETHQLESNRNNASSSQHIAKKPKLMWQSQDNSFDNISPSSTSVPSPVNSQMSNMSNSNKFIKMLGGRDRDRKYKLLKMPSGQSGSGSAWSLFEDQALVVLAHDLGPNWELVSDAFNSTLHFKYIFRKAKECKERHMCLMDGSCGDGADSADDSGSSQPYPSTLPGIPKGSARQLFQRLQGPMEEDTLKSHFQKLMVIGQKQHFMKTRNDNQDPKQFQRPHSSHAIALSQVCPNNSNGGPVLTPLDLCDASISSPDLLPHSYQGAHSSVLANPNQTTTTQMLPASSATITSHPQGASNTMIGNNFSPLNTSPRYGSYNQMITGKSIPQSGKSASGAPGIGRGAHMLLSGNGTSMMSNANRNTAIPRSGLQGIPSRSMLNSGSALSPAISSGNMRTGAGIHQGSSIVKPRVVPSGLTQDPQRQMVVSEGVSHFEGLSSSCSTSPSPPVSSYPLNHQPSHAISPQSPHQSHFQGAANHPSNAPHQAYAIRLAKERQLPNRLKQQQFAAPNSSIPPVQLPPQTRSPPVSFSPSTNAQQKHQLPAQGVDRNALSGGSGLGNQTVKPQPRQQLLPSQNNRQQHPHQRQQLQAQQAKVVKIVGRGSSMMHLNNPTDVSLLNGVSKNPGNPCLGREEPPIISAVDQPRSSSSIAGPNNQAPPHQKLANQNQPALQRIVQPNTASNSVQVVSQPSAQKWRGSEPLVDTNTLNSTGLPQPPLHS